MTNICGFVERMNFMKDLYVIYSHTFESYYGCLDNQAKTFIRESDTISSEFSSKNWREKDENLKSRKIKIMKLSVE